MKIIIPDSESEKIIPKEAQEDRTKFNSIFTNEKFVANSLGIIFNYPIKYSNNNSDEDKIAYYLSQTRKAPSKKEFNRENVVWKSREIEKWKLTVTQISMNLDDIISGCRSRVRDSELSINYLDAKGIYYDGMNLIYILFYSKERHGLYISAFDISEREFYQFYFLGELLQEEDDEFIISASVYKQEKNRIYWYV